MRKMISLLLILFCIAALLCSCAQEQSASKTAQTEAETKTADVLGYRQIGQDEAAALMKSEENCIILDVRRQDEFDAGHIPNAICIPNETIGTAQIPALPDKDQLILVYCRSGRRSKEAAQKLAALGYTDIVEFGGIIDWTGEVVTD